MKRYWIDWYEAYQTRLREWGDGCDTMREHQSCWNGFSKTYREASIQVNDYFYAHAMRMNEEKNRRDALALADGRKVA